MVGPGQDYVFPRGHVERRSSSRQTLRKHISKAMKSSATPQASPLTVPETWLEPDKVDKIAFVAALARLQARLYAGRSLRPTRRELMVAVYCGSQEPCASVVDQSRSNHRPSSSSLPWAREWMANGQAQNYLRHLNGDGVAFVKVKMCLHQDGTFTTLKQLSLMVAPRSMRSVSK